MNAQSRPPLASRGGAEGNSPTRRSPVSDERGGGDGSSEDERLRVMIVDDSLTVRTILKRIVESDPQLAFAGTASSAERALAALVQCQHGEQASPPTAASASDPAAAAKRLPDVILLDLEMPGMGGLEALPRILETAPGVRVLVVSALTEEGAQATVAALATGAADTMLKPRPGQFDDAYRAQLLAKICAFRAKPTNRDETRVPARASDVRAEAGTPPAAARDQDAPSAVGPSKAPSVRPELIAIGASTGGIHALNLMLRVLTPAFDIPIIVTQHLPPSFIPVFARQIEVISGRPILIASDGAAIRRGEIMVAPGHGHLNLVRAGNCIAARISAEPARSGCLPSVDPMLESLAETCGGRGLAIVLSGMGRDGCHGARALHQAGGMIWIQDAQTSPVWGMPGAVSKAGLASLVAPPEALGQQLMQQFARNADADVNEARLLRTKPRSAGSK